MLRFLMYVKNCEGNSASNASTTETSPSAHIKHTTNHSPNQQRWRCFSSDQTYQKTHIACLVMQRTGRYHVTLHDRSSFLISLLCLHRVPSQQQQQQRV